MYSTGIFTEMKTKSLRTSPGLCQVSRLDDVSKVKELIGAGLDVNARDVSGKTPLHNACYTGSDEVINLLLMNKADVNLLDNERRTPLFQAVNKRRLSIVDLLITHGASVEVTDRYHKTAIHYAVEAGQCSIVESLLKASKNQPQLAIDVYGRTALHYAVIMDQAKILARLLARTAVINGRDCDGKTVLHLAAENGYTSCISVIVEQDCNELKDAKDKEGNTPLHLAALNGYCDACEILLDSGVNKDIVNSCGQSPLHLAATSPDTYLAMVQLLSKKPNIDCKDNNGNTPLLLAIKTGCSEMVIKLLDSGASLSASNDAGQNCINLAVDNGEKDICLAILSHKRWEEAFQSDDSVGQKLLLKLVHEMPDAAEIMMDRCINLSPHSVNHPLLTVTYNFRYLEAEPSTTSEKPVPEPVPVVMAKLRKENLLLHPIISEYLDQKWNRMGRYVFYTNFFLYLCFLSVMSFIIIEDRIRATEESVRYILKNKLNDSGDAVKMGNLSLTGQAGKILAPFTAIFSCMMIIKELFHFSFVRFSYFKRLTNWMELVLYFISLFYVIEYIFRFGWKNHHARTELGIITLFLAYTNILLFLRRTAMFQVYVEMFIQVVSTLIKVLLIFGVMILGSAIVFYLLFPKQNTFKDVHRSLGKAIVMLAGEIDYSTILTSSLGQDDPDTNYPLVPFKDVSYWFVTIFILIMTVGLMNLLVGLAVGDIQTMRRQAKMNAQINNIHYFKLIQDSIPRLVSRKLHFKEYIKTPNRRTFSQTIIDRLSAYDEEGAVQVVTEIRQRWEVLQKVQESNGKKRRRKASVFQMQQTIMSIAHRLDSKDF